MVKQQFKDTVENSSQELFSKAMEEGPQSQFRDHQISRSHHRRGQRQSGLKGETAATCRTLTCAAWCCLTEALLPSAAFSVTPVATLLGPAVVQAAHSGSISVRWPRTWLPPPRFQRTELPPSVDFQPQPERTNRVGPSGELPPPWASLWA